MEEETSSTLQEETSPVSEGQFLSADQVASVIVTTETETSVPQGQSVGSSCNPSTEESISFIAFDVVQFMFYSFQAYKVHMQPP